MDYLNLYRMILALFFVGLFFAPALLQILADQPGLVLRATALTYLTASTILFFAGRRNRSVIRLLTLIGSGIDVVALGILMGSLGGVHSGVPVALVGVVAAVAVLLPRNIALAYAAIATLSLMIVLTSGIITGTASLAEIPEAGMFGLVYFLVGHMANQLAARTRESMELAEQRSVDVANLAQLNELVIRRMRTGVLVVDEDRNIRLMNESAWYLMGMPPLRRGQLGKIKPLLASHLEEWVKSGTRTLNPVALAKGVPRVVPRFANIGDADAGILIFLEDSRLIAKRAEEITLSSLARLSSSIAHEIRNPLAAISHASQLLEESSDLIDADKRLARIVTTHCQRMNDIIENVLQISRREQADPKLLDLSDWVQNFVSEYLQTHNLDDGSTLQCDCERGVVGVFDRRQLNQVVWNLTQNALTYGHPPGEPSQVTIRVTASGPALEVSDRGPGIPEAIRQKVFEPFFTTSEAGTGIGLYIARQICEANGAELDYNRVDSERSVFRVTFASTVRPLSP
ncbi:MAG: two-component sensor histidine kinase [Lysobacteraceae bacterium]|nr:MAG: two-component sensor histidine kinase [Xanthomonadaceae bacterium]